MVSNLGTWMQSIAVGVLVTEQTGKSAWTALAAAAAFLPMGLLSPVGGALADRLDRRRFMILGNVVEAFLAAFMAFLVATDRASPGVIVGVTAIAGSMTALRMPFYQAVIPDIVEREDLVAAVSLGSTQWNMGRVLGPALAAIVISLGSFTWAFTINAVSFFAVIAALLVVRFPVPSRSDDHHLGMWARIRAGARAARREPGCRNAITLIGIVGFLVAPFIALTPAMGRLLTGGGEDATSAATGALTTAQGIGAVIGALLLAGMVERFGRTRVLVASLVATPVSVAVYAVMPNVISAAALIAVVGATYINVLSGLSTVVQLRAPEQFRGRILSLHWMALGVIYPIGALVQGAVADRFGLRETTVAGAVLLLAVVAFVALARPHVFSSLGDPPADDPPLGEPPPGDDRAGHEEGDGASSRRSPPPHPEPASVPGDGVAGNPGSAPGV